ncbi:hypothetical protein LP419_01215 [Massilia sp. H-1]|nr:hypothetical protein LP419_01215 [Massilia sp. H-1]
MLQDLDARGSQSGASLQAEIKPVLAAEPRLPLRRIAIGATVLVLAMAMRRMVVVQETACCRTASADDGSACCARLARLSNGGGDGAGGADARAQGSGRVGYHVGYRAASYRVGYHCAGYCAWLPLVATASVTATVPSPETAAAPRRAVKPVRAAPSLAQQEKARPAPAVRTGSCRGRRAQYER